MSSVVNTLGLVAGSAWICVSLYFQLIREGEVHPKFVIGPFLVGAGIIMGSSAAALPGRPVLVQILATAANLLFLLLAIGVGIHLRRCVDPQDCHTPTEDSSRV